MPDFGIKSGTDINTNADIDLSLTSEYSSLKLYKWVDVTLTTNGAGTGSVVVPHDLGYTPIVQVWGKHDSQFPFLSNTIYPDTFSLIDSFNSYRPYGRGIDYYADDNQIVIRTIAVGGIGGGASPNTTYAFRVLIWVDKSEAFSGVSNITLTDDYGFKVSNPGINVLTDKEYNMSYSSKYKAIQYYPSHVLTASLTLPKMWASIYDQQVQEAVYVDFNHSLGYPPMFLVYSDLGGASMYEMPYAEVSPVGPSYDGILEVSAWCDSDRVRVLFHRESVYQGVSGKIYNDQTIDIRLIIFTENLEGV